MTGEKQTGGEIIDRLSAYVAASGETELPPEVIHKAKHHILDTLGAIVCGSNLKPGLLAKRFVAEQGGAAEAQVAGTSVVTTAIQAAFAMGMMAHSDETDDSHERAGMHPGCAIVPAALAVAQREGADGARFIRAVVAGYDIGCRMTQALGVQNVRSRALSLHGIGTNFGAAAAAASYLGLKEDVGPLRLGLFLPAGFGQILLDARQGPRREGLRLRRDGGPQRRHLGAPGPVGIYRG